VRAPAAKRRRSTAKSLIDTAGPQPSAALDTVRLTIGVIAGTHGVQGELKLKVLSDHPEHIPTLDHVYLGESDTPIRLLGARFHGDLLLIRLDGITNPEDGKRLGGLKVRIDGADAVPLAEGEYFLFQLVGLEARSVDGNVLGTVTDIMETGAHDVLVLATPEGGELLVPNHPEFVLEIAPDAGTIVMRPPVYDS
jgi:16S rRNA processing protein RimM